MNCQIIAYSLKYKCKSRGKTLLSTLRIKHAKACFIALLLLSASHNGLKAQNRHIIDSLQNQLKKFDAFRKELGSNSPPLVDTTKANLLYNLTLQYWANVPDTATYYDQNLLTLSQHIGYQKGIGNAYNGMGLINMQTKNYAVSLSNYKKAIQVRTEIGDKTGLAWTYNNIGLYYGNQGDFEEEISYHLKSIKIKEEIGDKVGIAASYGKIGHAYSELGKFADAVSNYLNALKIGEEDNDNSQIEAFYSDIGDLYYNQGNYKEALTNYRDEFKIATKNSDTIHMAYPDINLGRVFYKLGNYTDAIKYMLASLKIWGKTHDKAHVAEIHYYLGLVYLAKGNYAMALNFADSSLKEFQVLGSPHTLSEVDIELASIYEKQGKLKDALDLATQGLSLAKPIGARIEMQDAYIRLAAINAEMQNYKGAYESYQNYVVNLDSISSNEIVKRIETLEMNYAFNRKEDSARIEEEKNTIIKTAESNRKSIITLSAIVISVLTLILAALLISRQQLRHRKDTIIFEKDKRQMESELTNAKIVLDDYIQNMAEKNKLLEEFKTDLEGFKNLYDKERIEKLDYLNKATILTDEHWNKFKQLFEQVHKDFFKRLKEKLPDLTQSEMRLISLTKLSIGTKQMAGILGVSFDTIKKSRHRLRKKLGLSEEDSIDDVVNSI